MKKFKITIFFLFIALFLSGLSSCTKKPDNRSEMELNEINEAELVTIDENDLIETNEDLLDVDFRPFYDELSEAGEWIEVTGDEIGINKKSDGTSSGTHNNFRSMTYKEVFGMKKAKADVSMGAFFVWRPSPNLAVSVVAVDQPAYVPYTNGQWLYTDAGWYFHAATPVEEITHHHGRWVYSPTAGWLWVPGRVWAPAWVDWRVHETYIAWAPIPPGIYIRHSVIMPPPIIVDHYVVVERRYFVEPMVYQYVYLGHKHKHKYRINEWRRLDGITVVNHTVVNRGPDITNVRTIAGQNIGEYRVNKVKDRGDAKIKDNNINSYSPEFKKHRNPQKNTVTRPEKFDSYSEIKKKGSDNFDRSSDNSRDKNRNVEKNNKNRDNNEKGKIDNERKQQKQREDGNIRKDGNKNKQDSEVKKQRDKRGNENHGNDNIGKERKGNERKGNENKGNERKGNENKGNENKGNENKGNENKGSDKKRK
jgi:hypothetical protein